MQFRSKAGLLALAFCACKPSTKDQADAAQSPNATLQPAPVEAKHVELDSPRPDASSGPVGMSLDELRGAATATPSQLPPEPLRPDVPPPQDRFRQREFEGLSMTGTWTWSGTQGPPQGVDGSASALDELKKLVAPIWNMELAAVGRMRIVFAAPSFSVAMHTELRARDDRYGHILVWPEGVQFRVVPAGALRALLDERRVDVTPLADAKRGARVPASQRFGFPTEVETITTPWGSLVLQQARAQNAGRGGMLLCRTLVELVGGKPTNEACEPDRVPVRADYTWPGGAKTHFEVTSLFGGKEFPSGPFATPPPAAEHLIEGLPPKSLGLFATAPQLAKLRTRSEKVPPSNDAEAPAEGLVAENRTNALRFLWLDGVPIAWVPAQGRQFIIGPLPSRYNFQWRSFLGGVVGEKRDTMLPARIILEDKK